MTGWIVPADWKPIAAGMNRPARAAPFDAATFPLPGEAFPAPNAGGTAVADPS